MKQKVTDLAKVWEHIKVIIVKRINKASKQKSLYESMLKFLDNMMIVDKFGHYLIQLMKNYHAVWIIYRVLEEESKICVSTKIVKEILPVKLGMLEDHLELQRRIRLKRLSRQQTNKNV